jgi:hypothetical protein
MLLSYFSNVWKTSSGIWHWCRVLFGLGLNILKVSVLVIQQGWVIGFSRLDGDPPP